MAKTFIKFKKERKVTSEYQLQQEPVLAARNSRKMASLDLNKEDYGVYSRSVDRTFYFTSQSVEKSRVSQNDKKSMYSRNFYRNYMKSYPKRNKFL